MKGTLVSALATSCLLAAWAFADMPHASDTWRIELSGQALTSGALVFRVTPRQGAATDISVNVRSGRAEDNVAKDVHDAFAAKLSPQLYSVEVDGGEDVVIRKKDGQRDFALELVDASVRNVSIKVEGD